MGRMSRVFWAACCVCWIPTLISRGVFAAGETTQFNNDFQRTKRASMDTVEKEQLSMSLLMNVTDPAIYNKNVRPPTGDDSISYDEPLLVYHSAYVYYVSSLNPSSQQYSIQMLLRQKWRDPRLSFRGQLNMSEWEDVFDIKAHDRIILDGEEWLADRIWTPNIFFVNEHDSTVFDFTRMNVYVAIDADGQVYYNIRLRVQFYCEIDLTLFPFDDQVCRLKMESWALTDAHLVLKWMTSSYSLSASAVEVSDEFFMEEYELREIKCREEIFDYPHHIVSASSGPTRNRNVVGKSQTSFTAGNIKAIAFDKDADGHDSVNVGSDQRILFKDGNYSGLIVELHFSRVFQHYILDYYVPSLFLVVTSWVSFWLDPNAAPARVTLGTSTMLTFITLARNTESALPKVAYIKSIEIWFFACISFIFFSLAEFALVHGIQGSKKEVYEVKKATPSHIIKRAISPSVSRKNSDGDLASYLGSSHRGSSKLDFRKTISVPGSLGDLTTDAELNHKNSHLLGVYDNPAFSNNLTYHGHKPPSLTIEQAAVDVVDIKAMHGKPNGDEGLHYHTIGSLDSALSFRRFTKNSAGGYDSEDDGCSKAEVLTVPDGCTMSTNTKTRTTTTGSEDLVAGVVSSIPDTQTAENLRKTRDKLRNHAKQLRPSLLRRFVPDVFTKKTPTIVVFDDDDGCRRKCRADPPITPRRAAKIIDQYARWAFPLLFGIFNAFYWSYVALS